MALGDPQYALADDAFRNAGSSSVGSDPRVEPTQLLTNPGYITGESVIGSRAVGGGFIADWLKWPEINGMWGDGHKPYAAIPYAQSDDHRVWLSITNGASDYKKVLRISATGVPELAYVDLTTIVAVGQQPGRVLAVNMANTALEWIAPGGGGGGGIPPTGAFQIYVSDGLSQPYWQSGGIGGVFIVTNGIAAYHLQNNSVLPTKIQPSGTNDRVLVTNGSGTVAWEQVTAAQMSTNSIASGSIQSGAVLLSKIDPSPTDGYFLRSASGANTWVPADIPYNFSKVNPFTVPNAVFVPVGGYDVGPPVLPNVNVELTFSFYFESTVYDIETAEFFLGSTIGATTPLSSGVGGPFAGYDYWKHVYASGTTRRIEGSLKFTYGPLGNIPVGAGQVTNGTVIAICRVIKTSGSTGTMTCALTVHTTTLRVGP